MLIWSFRSKHHNICAKHYKTLTTVGLDVSQFSVMVTKHKHFFKMSQICNTQQVRKHNKCTQSSVSQNTGLCFELQGHRSSVIVPVQVCGQVSGGSVESRAFPLPWYIKQSPKVKAAMMSVVVSTQSQRKWSGGGPSTTMARSCPWRKSLFTSRTSRRSSTSTAGAGT